MKKNLTIEKIWKQWRLDAVGTELTSGENSLMHMYQRAKREGFEVMRLKEIVWDKDRASFLKALNDWNVKEFDFISGWSSAVELLSFLVANGYAVKGAIDYVDYVDFHGVSIMKSGLRLVRKAVK